MQQIDYRISDPLLDAFEEIHGGEFLDKIASTYGISKTDARLAIDELVPPLTRSIRGNIATQDGLKSFLNALATGNHAKYLDQTDLLEDNTARDDGNAILGHLLGSKEVSRAVAARASFGTGIGGMILQKLLPYIASILMGMIAKRMGGGGGGGGIQIPMPGGSGQRTSRRPSSGGGGWFGGGGNFDDLLGDLSDRSRDAMGGGVSDGGRSYVPEPGAQQSGSNPFERMRDIVGQQGGGFGGGSAGNQGGFIRDMIGGALGGKSKGIMGSIVSFLIYRYGWSFVKRLIGRFLGGVR